MNDPLPTLNVELLADVVTWAVADEKAINDLKAKYPDWGDWNQSTWATEVRNGVCQTSYCIAGQAVVQVGYGLVLPRVDDLESLERCGYDFEGYDEDYIKRCLSQVNANTCAPKVFAGLDDKGRPKYRLDYDHEVAIPNAARNALGLTDFEGSALFEGDNSIESVVTIAFMIARARGEEVFNTFVAAVPQPVRDVMDEACEGEWEKGYAAMQNIRWFPTGYLADVVPPVDVKTVLRAALDDQHDGGEVSDREYEAAIDWLTAAHA